MGRQRKFDHEEARRRYAAGESAGALAREYGVSNNAVLQVVSATVRASNRRAAAAYLERHRVPCEVCDKPCLDLGITAKRRHAPDGRALCLRCRMDERRERLRFDASGDLVAVRCSRLECANGDRWQTPGNFTAGQRHREIRPNGIHSQCRACQTRARQRYREQHRESERAYWRACKRRARIAA